MSLTVFLADDHAVVRDGLKLLLETEADIRWWAKPSTEGRQCVRCPDSSHGWPSLTSLCPNSTAKQELQAT